MADLVGAADLSHGLVNAYGVEPLALASGPGRGEEVMAAEIAGWAILSWFFGVIPLTFIVAGFYFYRNRARAEGRE